MTVLGLLSGLSCFQYASFAAAAVDSDDALGLCQIETIPKDIRGTLERRFYGWKVQESMTREYRAFDARSDVKSIQPPWFIPDGIRESLEASCAYPSLWRCHDCLYARLRQGGFLQLQADIQLRAT